MRVGLYLAYSPPNKKMSLKQEGLGRYVAELVKAFLNNGDSITIACPNWVIDSVEELLGDFGIDTGKVQYLTPKGEPVLYRLYLYKVLKVKKSKRKGRIERLALNFVDSILTFLLSLKSVMVFILLALITFAVGLIFIPFAFLALCIKFILKILNKINNKLFHFQLYLNKEPYIEFLKKIKFLRSIIKYVGKNYNSMAIQEKIRKSSAGELIRYINHSLVETDIWYCPMAFWPEFNNIEGIKVICVPDVVTGEFSESFSKYDSAQATNKVRKTICDGTFFITYCDYIKETLVEQYFGKDTNNIITIRHAVNETLPYINIQGAFVNKLNVKDPVMRFARTLLPGLIDKNINMHDYLGGNNYRFSFDNVSYIFYPSQIRGNKNLLTLVKAYEYLLREKNFSIKLFLTCNYNMDKELTDYINEHGLQYDILSFSQVSNQQLAALYKCAELTVTPTLYEGGFPFTFGEGMSVGTPAVMSRIPQVTREIKDYNLDVMLFDPYDYVDIAERIIYGLENREELYNKEKVLYKEMQKRNWDVVGKEYIKAFNYFIMKQY